MNTSSPDRFLPRFEQLPQTLPIFPLPGVILLPRVRLPLNIFEPRYLAMVEDALAAGRMIGMVQPSDTIGRVSATLPRMEDASDLYRIGCAGRITGFSETTDGRILITLLGICRFEITEEIRTLRGYRRIVPDWTHFSHDLASPEDHESTLDRKHLTTLLKSYFVQVGINPDWEMIAQSDDSDLIDSLAMICPFGSNEKQALLEAKDLATRSKLVMTMVEMATLEKSGDARPRH